MRVRHDLMSAREAAYCALIHARRGEFLEHSLMRWRHTEGPKESDWRLAQELAYGTARRWLTLKGIVATMSAGRGVSKLEEEALLYLSIYQLLFMDRIPVYAILSEGLELAKRYIHPVFGKYLHALLSRLQREVPPPKDEEERYSLPEWCALHLMKTYGEERGREAMRALLEPPRLMARKRVECEFAGLRVEEGFEGMALVEGEVNPELFERSELYFQNVTSKYVYDLLDSVPAPERVLDLCAAPGGKLLMCRDRFPAAHLWANEPSKKRMAQLQRNLSKYGVEATVTAFDGEFYPEKGFDLILIDAPCSNSGVCHKCPEARWRLTPKEISMHAYLQKRLMLHAATLLHEGGHILYSTCSILPEENEWLVRDVLSKKSLSLLKERSILPSKNGWEGGYGALLKQKTL